MKLRNALGSAVAVCALVGCWTYDLPKTAEAGLVLGSREVVYVNALSCRPDGSVVATGYTLSGLHPWRADPAIDGPRADLAGGP
jgi:hypothetical protein